MPKVEVLRRQLMDSRLTVKRLRRQLDEARALENRKRDQLQAALARRAARLVDAELGGES